MYKVIKSINKFHSEHIHDTLNKRDVVPPGTNFVTRVS